MSSFHHARRIQGATRPDLRTLVATAVSRQALLPTALAVAMDRDRAPEQGRDRGGIASLFVRDAGGPNSAASFHTAIAARLLTEGK